MAYHNHGWVYYKDSTYTSGSPLAVNNARVQLTNDGLGSTTETSFAPHDMSLWVGDKITPPYVGSSFSMRVDFKADPAGVSDWGDFQLDIGSGAPINVVTRTVTMQKSGVNAVSIGVPIFCLTTFVTNGGKLYFDTSTSGDSIDVYDIAIFLAMN